MPFDLKARNDERNLNGFESSQWLFLIEEKKGDWFRGISNYYDGKSVAAKEAFDLSFELKLFSIAGWIDVEIEAG